MRINYCLYVLLLSALLLLLPPECCPGEKVLSVSTRRQLSTNYKDSEIDSLEILLSNALRDGLPSYSLVPVITKAAREKKKYQKLRNILNLQLKYLRTGHKLVWDSISDNHKVKDLNQAIIVVSDYLEKGLAPEDWSYLLYKLKGNTTVEDIITYAGFIVSLKDNGYSAAGSREIVAAVSKRKISEADKIIGILSSVPGKRGENTAFEFITRNKSISWLEKELKIFNKAH